MKNKFNLAVFSFHFVFIISFNNLSAQWVPCNLPVNDNVTSLSLSSATIFAGTGGNGIYKTTNNGTNWTQTQLIFTNTKVLFSYGYTTFSSGINNGIFKTSNWGLNWIPTSLGNGYTINCFTNLGTWFYAGGANINGCVYLSFENGVNWGPVLFDCDTIYSLAGRDTNVYAGSSLSGGKIFYSTDRGFNWSSFNLHNIGGSVPYSLSASWNGYVFAGTASTGVFVSSNKGISWTQTSLNNKRVNSIISALNVVIAGTQDSGIYMSTNNGQTWTSINQGFPLPLTVNSLLVVNSYLYAGTNYKTSSIWKRPGSELIGVFETNQNEISSSYALSQNYPNPFNSMTNVKWQMLNAGYARIIVYDLAGKEVAVLVNEKKAREMYEVNFDSENLSSGIYFYSLYADGVRVDTKRMVLIK